LKVKFEQIKAGKQTLERYLDNTWSFGAIVSYLDREYKGRMFFKPMAIRKAWVEASSFSHTDAAALEFVVLREVKEQHRKDASNTMHVLKLMRMCVIYTAWANSLLIGSLSLPSIFDNFSKRNSDNFFKGFQNSRWN
jgi:hypothetical protein